MRPIKNEQPKEKLKFHPRNKNQERYDFKQLIDCFPQLASFVKPNIKGDESIDFSDWEAVKSLNKALLLHQYDIHHWEIPPGYQCPPIPARADYIHYMADFLCRNNYGKIPSGAQIKCLDIGIGASCIFPIVGNREYGWSFVGADIDPLAIESAQQIVESNPPLQGMIECKVQTNSKDFFYGIIRKDELIDFSICNPPLYALTKEAKSEETGKEITLESGTNQEISLNPWIQNQELYYDGGEEKFIRNMILQSKKFASNCFCFSTLVSKESTLKSVYRTLEQVEAFGWETISMGQGNKISRIVAWTFLTTEEQNNWKNTKWKK